MKCFIDAMVLGCSEISLLHEEINKVLTKAKAAGLLRLVFHDAGTFNKGDRSGISCLGLHPSLFQEYKS